MSWAAIAAAGNSMQMVSERDRQQKIQDEQLAMQKQEQGLRMQQLGVQTDQLKQQGADATAKRDREKAYADLMKSTDPKDQMGFHAAMAAKARELGDTATYQQSIGQLATMKQKQYATDMSRAITQAKLTGDPSAMVNAYNAGLPDGNKIQLQPGSTPGMFKIVMTGADGKVQTGQNEVGVAELGKMAIFSMSPEVNMKVFEKDAEADIEIRKEAAKQDAMGKREKDVEGVKAEKQYKLEDMKTDKAFSLEDMRGKREGENIDRRAKADRANSMASIAASGGQARQTATWNSALNANALAAQGGAGDNEKAGKEAAALVAKAVDQGMMKGITPETRPLYINAAAQAEAYARKGMPPALAMKKAMDETAAEIVDKKAGSAGKAVTGAAKRVLDAILPGG